MPREPHDTPFGSFVWCRITVFPQTNSMSSGTACIRPSWYHWQRESRPAKVARDGCRRTPGCTLDSFRSLPSLLFATPLSRQSGRKRGCAASDLGSWYNLPQAVGLQLCVGQIDQSASHCHQHHLGFLDQAREASPIPDGFLGLPEASNDDCGVG